MKTAFPFISQNFEPWFKLQMLKGLKRFYTINLEENRLKRDLYYRSFCRVLDNVQNKYFEGMAEGHTQLVARMRAFSEAYERLCFCEFKEKNKNLISLKFPFGLGVGLRHSSAKRRAYGEYYERLTVSSLNTTSSHPKEYCKKYHTSAGQVFVALIKNEEGLLGSGYGNSTIDALDSAKRSLSRKTSFPQPTVHFKTIHSEPKVFCITPTKDSWLECYFVGHTK